VEDGSHGAERAREHVREGGGVGDGVENLDSLQRTCRLTE
jgi:hypothetical protein